MSTGEDELVFESLLRKRKDKMRLKWVTYWFRLENTTLFFYSKKNGSPLHLKGQYYLCKVQSVHEIHKADNKRYAFEISLKNGKRKLLAADTADLRQTWVELLWKAMQLSEPGNADSASNSLWHAPAPGCDAAVLRQGRHGSSSDSDSGRGAWETERPRPASDQWDRTPPTQGYRPWSMPQAVAPYSSTLVAPFFDGSTWRYSIGQEEEEGGDELTEEGDYDVLPSRTSRCLINQEEEGIYDVPLCNMRATEGRHQDYRELTESIYDVPKALLRKMSEQSLGADV